MHTPVAALKLRRPDIWVKVKTDWLERAAQLPGKSLHVGFAIWRRAAVVQSPSFTLWRTDHDRFGVSRDALYDALTRLSAAGLVAVDRCKGRHPRVTLLDAGGAALRQA